MCSLCVVLALGRVFSPQRENSGGVLFMACTGGKGRKKEECQKWKTANHYQEKKVVQIFVEYESDSQITKFSYIHVSQLFELNEKCAAQKALLHGNPKDCSTKQQH